MGFFKAKSVVGIEMDAFEVRAAEVGRIAGKLSLLGLSRAYLPEGVVKDGKVARPEILSGIISRLWTESKFRSKNVMLGISNQDVLFRYATIPKCPEDKLDKIIRFQAQDFIPVPVNDVELDYMVLNEVPGEQAAMLRILLVAGRRSMLDGFLKAIGDAGMKLLDIDVSVLALARLVTDGIGDQTAAVVHYTGEQIGLVILCNGQPAFARIFSANAPGGTRVENVHDKTVGGEAAAAREPTRRESGAGLLNYGAMEEIGSSISYFLSQNAEAAVEKCMINAAAGMEFDLRKRLGEILGIGVETVDPVKSLDSYLPVGNRSFENAAEFSVCISLALRGLEE